MIDLIDNGIQTAALLLCVIAASVQAARFQSRTYALLAFFCGSWMLGNIYWTVFLLFYDKTPQISVISDLSWYASYLFLYLLLRHASPPEGLAGGKAVACLGPAFTVAMGLFYMRRGEIVSNLIYAGLMGVLLYAAIRRLAQRQTVYLAAVILIICLLEYALWTASCFWQAESLRNPYYWFDFLLTATFPFFFAAIKSKEQSGAAITG